MRRKSSRHHTRLESLEQRRLLAVDLVTEFIGTPAEVRVGEETEFTLRVSNVGDEDAFDVLVESDLTEALVDAEWQGVKYPSDTTRLDLFGDSLGQDSGIVLEGGSAFSGRLFQLANIVGDINADGFDDVVMSTSNDQLQVFFGSAKTFTEPVVPSSLGVGKALQIDLPEAFPPSEISRLGDVNGDGIDDFGFGVVDPSYSGEGGGVFIVFGDSGLSSQKRLALEELAVVAIPETIGQVSAAGDIDGDGTDDVLVQHYEVISGEWHQGTSLIYGNLDLPTAGTTTLDNLVGEFGFTITDTMFFQRSVPAGDINGDGLDDIILSQNWRKFEWPQSKHVLLGRADRLSGTIPLEMVDGELGFILSAPNDGTWELAAVGDLNNDGFDDLAFWVSTGERSNSEVSLMFGSSELHQAETAVPTASLVLENTRSFLGSQEDPSTGAAPGYFLTTNTMHPVDDFNGDGIADLLLGKQGSPHLVLLGGSHLDETRSIDLLNISPEVGAMLNLPIQGGFLRQNHNSLSQLGAGDVNGDGVSDVLVRGKNLMSSEDGFHVAFGQPSLNGHGSIQKVVDLPAGDFIDFNIRGIPISDGANRITASATGCTTQSRCPERSLKVMVTPLESERGVEVRLSNPFPNPVTVNVRSEIPSNAAVAAWQRLNSIDDLNVRQLHGANGYILRSNGVTYSPIPSGQLSSLGDLTGDGINDFVFVEGHDIWTNVYIESGVHSRTEQAVRFVGENFESHERFPRPVAALGDFNGDGFGDISWMYNTFLVMYLGGSQNEKVVLNYEGFVGEGDLRDPTTICCQLQFGGGDWNADGFDDLLLSGPERTIVLFGHDVGSPSGTESFELTDNDYLEIGTSNVTSGHLGGDINGDGIADLIFATEGQAFAYVLFGGIDLNGSSQDIQLDQLDGTNGYRLDTGYSIPFDPDNNLPRKALSFVGDVNSDGYDDMAMSTASGAVLVYGDEDIGANGSYDNTNSQEAQTQLISDTPLHMSALGDFNGDGTDDIAIAAVEGEPGVSVLFGSRSIDSHRSIDVRDLDGLNGMSVVGFEFPWRITQQTFSNAGDLNGDGVNDLLVAGIQPKYFWGGDIYVVFGRDEYSNGVGDIVDLNLTVEPNGSTRYIVQGDFDEADIERLSIEVNRSGPIDANEQTNSAVTFLFAAPRRADLNADGLVSALDFEILRNNFGRKNAISSDGDLNDDGRVDFADFLLLNELYTKELP